MGKDESILKAKLKKGQVFNVNHAPLPPVFKGSLKKACCNNQVPCVPQSCIIHAKPKEQHINDPETARKYSNAKSYQSW